MSQATSVRAGVLGFFVGMIVAGGSYFAATMFAGADAMTAAIIWVVAAVIGAGYAALAFSNTIYPVGLLSLLGFVLDLSWSLLNTLAGFLVWIPACKIKKAGYVTPTDHSRRSGTFVYNKNPRGGGYDATTIGTIIAGGWSSHEETHVWQARIFGPTYMLTYVIAWLLNIPFRLVTGKTKNLTLEAYYRIPFEDWAYLGASTSGSHIEWRKWLLGFLLAFIYTSALISIAIGFALGLPAVWLTGVVVLTVYSLIRAFAPRRH
jgi:hypothetical protein